MTREDIDELYRTESRQILATLIRRLGDFDLAEETLVHCQNEVRSRNLIHYENDLLPLMAQCYGERFRVF